MCYNAEKRARDKLKNDIFHARNPEERRALIQEFERLWPAQKEIFFYHVSGFQHPKLLLFNNVHPLKPQEAYWGLIPHWVRDETTARDIMNRTLNARSEEMFEKASYKQPARTQRCLIVLEAFYEHHHRKGKTFPFRIAKRDGSPLMLAGLWDEWYDESSGQSVPSCTIVTTEANPMMQFIHNNPKNADGPRMPVILEGEDRWKWLNKFENGKEKEGIAMIKSLCKPCDENLLKAYTVPRLSGKEYPGNIPEVTQKKVYPELAEVNFE
jgi:putative SOS response-associated peptidase YedK